MSILVTDINTGLCSISELQSINEKVCIACGSNNTSSWKHKQSGKSYPRWYKFSSGGYECTRCWKKRTRSSTMNYRQVKNDVFIHYFGENFHCDGTMNKTCDINDIRVLGLDHVNGGGNIQRKQLFGSTHMGGMKFYAWLKSQGYPDFGLRPRCANCHMIIENERVEMRYKKNGSNEV